MNKLNILVSHPYLDKTTIEYMGEHARKINLLIDSGAFTAFNNGKPVGLKDYYNSLREVKGMNPQYFTLDVIGQKDKTINNYKRMLDDGYRPIPIFTPGQTGDVLDFYYENSEVVAVGGLGSVQSKLGYLKNLMAQIGDRKTHWLGFSNQNYLRHYKPFSCDVSSHTVSKRFKTLNVYMGQGKWKILTIQELRERPSRRILDTIRRYGVDPRDLLTEENWANCWARRPANAKISARGWVKYAHDIQRITGTKYYFACTSPHDVRDLVEAFTLQTNAQPG